MSYSVESSWKLEDPEIAAKVRRREEKRKQVLKKYMQRTTDSEATKSEMSEKSFDNLFVEALSPQARSPMFDETKLAKMEKELAADRTLLHGLLGRTFFFLNCVFSVKFFVMLPVQMMHHGGWYFLMPLVVCVVVLALPMAFLELVLGQLTSQLSTLIFSRISPIAVGVGLIFPILRLFFFINIRTEHRNVSFMLEILHEIFFTERNVVCWKQNATDCYIPNVCKEGHVFFRGACYDREALWKDKRITSQMNVRLSAFGLLQHPDFYSDPFVRPIPHVDRILNDGANTHRLDAVITFFIVVFVFSLLGIRKVTKLMPLVHAAVGAGLVLIVTTMLISDTVRHSFGLFVETMSFVSDARLLTRVETWQTAAVASLAMLAVGDGTLHALGALGHFNGNIFFDLALVFCSWLAFVVFSTFFFGTIVVAGIGVQIREETDLDLNAQFLAAQSKLYPYRLPIMQPMYYFSLTDYWTQWAGFALYALILVLQIAPHVLMAENVLTVVVRAVPQLQGLNRGVVRHCLLFPYFCLMGILYSASIGVAHSSKEQLGVVLCYLLLILICYECIAVHRLYQISRLVVNIRTMLEKSASAYRQAKSLETPLFYLWSAVIPILAGLLFATSMLALMRSIQHHLLVVLVLFLAGLPVCVGTVVLLKQWLKRDGRMHKLFRPTPDWGPFTIKDKKNVNWDERAARLIL